MVLSSPLLVLQQPNLSGRLTNLHSPYLEGNDRITTTK